MDTYIITVDSRHGPMHHYAVSAIDQTTACDAAVRRYQGMYPGTNRTAYVKYANREHGNSGRAR